MISKLDQTAKDPFWFRECFLMTMPVGIRVGNLRELLHVIKEVDDAALYYHLFQCRLVISPPTIEYPNDFAQWAGLALQEKALAEKLSSFDPLDYADLNQVRQAVVDIMEEHLWELPFIPWARPGFEFHFCEASTVVIRSEIAAANLREFCQGLKKVGLDSIYYHFFEARWRLEKPIDDFSYWIETNFDVPELVTAIRDIDIYFYSLREIRNTLLGLIDRHLGETCGKSQ